jgi:hypothetical protein
LLYPNFTWHFQAYLTILKLFCSFDILALSDSFSSSKDAYKNVKYVLGKISDAKQSVARCHYSKHFGLGPDQLEKISINSNSWTL